MRTTYATSSTRLGRIEFWKIAIKPGKPLAYGRIDNCHFFGLPGNPVSTIVTFLMLVKPMLATLAGTPADPPLRVSALLMTSISRTNPVASSTNAATYRQR